MLRKEDEQLSKTQAYTHITYMARLRLVRIGEKTNPILRILRS